MKNTEVELNEALALMDTAKKLQAKAEEARIACTNYIEEHVELPLYRYGTDLMYSMSLHDAIRSYISGDPYAEGQKNTLVRDIKDAMNITEN